MADDWNVLAGRLVGGGEVDIVETDLPIAIGSIDRTLSAPGGMTAALTNKVERLKKAGRPILERQNTVIIAEASGIIRGMGVYQQPTFDGPVWNLDLMGLSGYPIGMPYTAINSFVDADPLDIYRHFWAHLQSQPGGDLGITIDDLTSPVRIGTTEEPRKFNWWDTTNIGAEIDSLASEAPFDWLETVAWNGDRPHCHIRLGQPIIGARKPRLRLVYGENLATDPSAGEAEYLNELWVLGAGEGRDRVRGYAGVTDGRIRRSMTIMDEKLKTQAQADRRAAQELARRRGQIRVEQVEVYDHPNAPLAALEPGDSVQLYAEMPWVTIDQWVRVVGKSETPQSTDRAALTVVSEEVLT